MKAYLFRKKKNVANGFTREQVMKFSRAEAEANCYATMTLQEIAEKVNRMEVFNNYVRFF